jgi:hypothetical protein
VNFEVPNPNASGKIFADLTTVGVVRFQIGFAARVDLQRAIGPWPLAGLAEPAGAALKLSTVLRTIGDVFDGEFNPLTDVGESRLVGLEALTNAFENFVQVDHEGEHEHKPLTLHLHLQLHKRESSTLSTALRERQARAFRAFFQPQDRGIAAQRTHEIHL